MQPVTIEELKKVIALSDLPDEHLQWILSHSHYQEFEEGDIVLKTGEPIEDMIIIVEGKIDLLHELNGRPVFYFSFENDELSGGMGGLTSIFKNESITGYFICIGKDAWSPTSQELFSGARTA